MGETSIRIAAYPASPRDHSRLFVYDTAKDRIQFDRFYRLDRYLPKNSFLVMNKTKVLPARMTAKKETGGKVELLLLINEPYENGMVKSLSDRKIAVAQKLFLTKHLFFEVVSQQENIFLLKPNFSPASIPEILMKHGITPIPKYIRHSSICEKDLRKKYQSIFAKSEGSIAAPTASLHFTNRVFKKLRQIGIPNVFITLHVGLGTFAPVHQKNFEEKKLFEEYFEISEKTAGKIQRLKRGGKELIAVGTTAVRTLESWARGMKGKTNLFIFHPFHFKMVDHLITNFHLPNSSLMILVDAFLQHKKARRSVRDLYQIAAKNNFRFYSFGDAMLIL